MRGLNTRKNYITTTTNSSYLKNCSTVLTFKLLLIDTQISDEIDVTKIFIRVHVDRSFVSRW